MWLQAIRDAVVAFLSALAAFYAGTIKREHDQYEDDLKALEAAAKAAGRVELMPDADVVRVLEERRLYRLSDEPPHSE
jgi:hypothetical protein